MDEKLQLNDDRQIFVFDDIKDSLQKVYDQFRRLKYENEHLLEENKRLKSESYKDKELAQMKASYVKMQDDYYRGFPISKEEMERIHKWMDKIIGNGPDMKINSARFYYKFYPTPLGVSGEVIDSISGQKFEFQEIG